MVLINADNRVVGQTIFNTNIPDRVSILSVSNIGKQKNAENKVPHIHSSEQYQV